MKAKPRSRPTATTHPHAHAPRALRPSPKAASAGLGVGSSERQQSPVFYDPRFQLSLAWFHEPNLFCLSLKVTVKFDSPFHHRALKSVLLHFRFAVERQSEKRHVEFHCAAHCPAVFPNPWIFREAKCIRRYFSLFKNHVALSLTKRINLPPYCSCAINSYFIHN